MSEEIELVGTITKLDDGFAYAKTTSGNVYIPIAAARNKSETLNSLKDKFSEMFRYQEEVFMTVIQQHGKNSCKFLATRVKSIETQSSGTSTPSKREVLSPEVHGPIVAKITSTEDAFAFAQNDEEFGTIFIPGDAFDSAVVRCVRRYVSVGDVMLLTVKRQKSHRGCSWLAVTATKHYEEEEGTSSAMGNVITSFGKIIELQPSHVDVWDEKHLIMVTCPQLTYTGGLRGRRARNLLDLFEKGENVMFKAIISPDGQNEAIEWKHIGENEDGLVLPKMVQTCDAITQTAPEMTYLLMKSILRENPKYAIKFKSQIDLIPDAAVSDPILLDRESRNFKGWDAC